MAGFLLSTCALRDTRQRLETTLRLWSAVQCASWLLAVVLTRSGGVAASEYLCDFLRRSCNTSRPYAIRPGRLGGTRSRELDAAAHWGSYSRSAGSW